MEYNPIQLAEVSKGVTHNSPESYTQGPSTLVKTSTLQGRQNGDYTSPAGAVRIPSHSHLGRNLTRKATKVTTSQSIAGGTVAGQVVLCEQRSWGLGPKLEIPNENGVTPTTVKSSDGTTQYTKTTH